MFYVGFIRKLVEETTTSGFVDEAGRKNVINHLYFAISNHFADLWPLGFGFIPRFANLAGIYPCIWNLATSFLLCSTVAKEVRTGTSRKISQLTH